jgi:hypothetical protein
MINTLLEIISLLTLNVSMYMLILKCQNHIVIDLVAFGSVIDLRWYLHGISNN